jgi:hypothetical protein
LTAHNCINLRLPTYGGLYAWEFERNGQELNVHVQGQLVFNSTPQMLAAALDGFGLAYIPEDVAEKHVAEGQLERVLEDWSPTFPGYHLYYPSRRQSSPAFALLVDSLRYRRPSWFIRPGWRTAILRRCLPASSFCTCLPRSTTSSPEKTDCSGGCSSGGVCQIPQLRRNERGA